MANLQHHRVTIYGKYDELVILKKYCKGKNGEFDVEKMQRDLPQLYDDMIKKYGTYRSFDSSFEIINSGKAEVSFTTKWAVAYPHISMLSARFRNMVFVIEANDDVLNSSWIYVFYKGHTLVEEDLSVDVLMARGLTRKEAINALKEEDDKKN